MSTLVVYTKPACMQCTATFRALDNRGLHYQKIDVTQDGEAHDYIRSLGYLAVPVVHVSPTEHWSGFRPDRLAGIAA